MQNNITNQFNGFKNVYKYSHKTKEFSNW